MKELENFRAKYPGYDDLNDNELSSMLIAKHPEYKDILGTTEPDTLQEVQELSPQFKIDTTRKQLVYDELVKRGMFSPPTEIQPSQPKEPSGATMEYDFIKPTTWKSVIGQAVENTPKSAAQFIEDIITPFMHPVDTAKAIGGLAQGLGQKFIPGRQDQEDIVDDLVEMFKDRYGGIENLKKTIANDPVGIGADISTLLIPAGKVTQLVGGMSKTSKVAKTGKILSIIGEATEPITSIGKVVKKTATKLIPKDTPSNLYRRGAKISESLPLDIRKKIAKTGLDKEIMPNISGLDKLRSKIDVINDEITKKIDSATLTGKKVPVETVLKDLNKLRSEALLSGEPVTQLRSINNIAKQIREVNKKIGKTDFTPSELQKLKQNIYNETESLYSKASQSPIKGKTKQAIAKSAKEALEDIFPEIKQLNKKEGALIELKKQIDRSAGKLTGKDFLDTGPQIKTAIGGGVGGIPGAAAGMGIGLLDTAQVRAKLGIVLNRLKEKGVVLPDDSFLRKYLESAPGGVTVATRQAGKLTESLEEGKENE